MIRSSILITLIFFILNSCSNRQNSLTTGEAVGATVGAAGGAMIGGMFGLLISSGGNKKSTDAILATSMILGAISFGSTGYSVGKIFK